VNNLIRDFLHFILKLFSPTSFIGIDTRTVDRHIEELNQHQWFSSLYHNEKYRKQFFMNVHIRSYLESKRRVNKLIDDPVAREKFMELLQKQQQR
jgi:hypothetical protein